MTVPRIAIAVGAWICASCTMRSLSVSMPTTLFSPSTTGPPLTFASISRCMPSVTDSSRVNEMTFVVITSRTEVGIEAPCRLKQIQHGGDEVGQVAGDEPVSPA